MQDSYPLLKRFVIIVEQLKQRPLPLKVLLEYLHEQGFEISKRTLQRDIEQLKTDFDIDIQYDSSIKAYCLRKDSSSEFDILLRIIQLTQTTEILYQSTQNKEEGTLSYISFEKTNEYAGTELLKPILRSIHNRNLLSFEYENLTKGIISSCRIKPFLLKEYNHKWYIIGCFTEDNNVRLFALDRISKLQVMENESFSKEEREQVNGIFDHCIGINYNTHQPEIVEIAVHSVLAKYLERMPIHHSQSIKLKEAKQTIFSFYLSPNDELKQLLLKYGVQIKVLKPQWFAQQMMEEAKEIIKNYEEFS